MEWISTLGIALALAMDAFAVSMAAGVALETLSIRPVFRMAFHFGLFQAMMPILGWFAGMAVAPYIAAFDHWIAFGLLSLVGVRMITGAMGEKEDAGGAADPTRGWTLVMLSVATSIDALAVGLSLAMLKQPILFPALVIGLVAAGLSALGMVLGRRVGAMWGSRVEIVGGIILVGIGLKILVEHLA